MTSTLIYNVRLFDGESVLAQNGYILFSSGFITELDTVAPSPLPKADIVIDGQGNTLLPGLIDAHVHVYGGVYELEQALKFGVTTLLDMMNEPERVAMLKRAASERADVADIKSPLHAAIIEGGWPSQVTMANALDKEAAKARIDTWPKLRGSQDADAYIRKYKELGVDYIKLFQESGSTLPFGSVQTPSLELQTAVVDAAHSHGLITVAHALSLDDTLAVLKSGTDGMAHTFYDKAPTQELLEAYMKHNAFLVPTLCASATILGAENTSSARHIEHKLAEKVLDKSGKACFCGKLNVAKEGCKAEFAYETVKLVKRHGIDIICGTDTSTGLVGTAFGLSVHQELSLLVNRCDLAPIEALRSATGTTARRFGLKDRGRLDQRLRADLIMVRGDPTVDIQHTMDLVGIWRGGEALKG